MGSPSEIDAEAVELVVDLLRFVGWIAIVAMARVAYLAVKADSWVSEKHGTAIRECRDTARQGLVLPTLARIVVVAHESVSWPRRATSGQMEDRIRGELAIRVADFADPLRDLESHASHVNHTSRLHGQLVRSLHRQGYCALCLFPFWLVMLAWAYFGESWPMTVPTIAGAIAVGAMGWYLAEQRHFVAMRNSFSRLKRDMDAQPGRSGA